MQSQPPQHGPSGVPPSQSPFASGYPTSNPANGWGNQYQPPRQPRNTVFIILGVLGFIALLGCGGVGALFYLGYSAIQQEVADIDIGPPSRSIDEELATYNEQLQEYATQKRSDADFKEVDKFIGESVRTLQDGDEIPVHVAAFAEAVSKSTHGQPLSLFSRLQLIGMVEIEFPGIDVTENYTLIDVERTPNTDTFVATILFTSQGNWSFTSQWFLIKEQGRLMLYDHGCLEYGRRASDEWAVYMQHQDEPHAAGINEAVQLAYEAEAEHDPANNDETLRKMREAEATKVLPADQDETALRLAWAYQNIFERREALRLLRSLRYSTTKFGALPSLYTVLDQFGEKEEALEVAKELYALSPEDPDSLHVMGLALNASGEREAAVPYLLRYLKWCPFDSEQFYSLSYDATAETLLELTRIAGSREDGLHQIISMLEWRMGDPQRLVDYRPLLAKETKLPAHADLLRLVDAMIASGADPDSAGHELLQVARESEHSTVKETASRLWRSRLISQDKYGALLAEADDAITVLADLASQVIYDEFYGDSALLVKELRSTPDAIRTHPLSAMLIGLEDAQLADADAALALEPFLEWRQKSDQLDELVEEPEYFQELVLRRWFRIMLSLGRKEDIIRSVAGDDVAISLLVSEAVEYGHHDIVQTLLTNNPYPDWEPSSADRASMQAMLAAQQGNHAAAARELLSAIQVLASEGDDTAQVYPLAQQWGASMVASDDRPRPEDIAVSQSEPLQWMLSSLIDEAQKFGSDEALTWARQLYELNQSKLDQNAGGWVRSKLFSAEADRLIEANRVGDAIQALRTSLAIESEEGSYRKRLLASELIKLLASNGQFDEAIKLAEAEQNEYEQDMTGSEFDRNLATVLLKADRLEQLNEVIATASPKEISNWLSSDDVRVVLRRDRNLANSLLEKHKLSLSSEYSATDIYLGYTSRPGIDETLVRQATEAALPGPITISRVSLLEADASTAFRVVDGEGYSYAVIDRPYHFQQRAAYGVPAETEGHILVAAIEVDTVATTRCWELAKRFFSPQINMLYSNDLGRIWRGEITVERFSDLHRLASDAGFAGPYVGVPFPSHQTDGIAAEQWREQTLLPAVRDEQKSVEAMFRQIWMGHQVNTKVRVVGVADERTAVAELAEELSTELLLNNGDQVLIDFDELYRLPSEL